jgi:dephospho-CoA kinase
MGLPCPGASAMLMAMIRVLLTGISGVGKSTLVSELASLGYKAVDLDCDEFCQWVSADPHENTALTGTPVEPDRDWVWREDRVGTLLATEDADLLVVSGCASNMSKFRKQFDHVILVTAPRQVIAHRLATRTTNPYGKRPEEAARVLAQIDTIEVLLRRSADHVIDTSDALPNVVERVLKIVHTPTRGTPHERR